MKINKSIYVLEHRILGNGTHPMQFKLDENFFKLFEYSQYKNGNIIVDSLITINNSEIIGHFNFKGFIETQCDICLDNFNLPIDFTTDIVFKLSESISENNPSDEIVYIANSENKIYLEKHFYDYIILSLPIKKTHPVDKQGNRKCNPEILKKLEEYKSSDTKKDPRWDKLKDFFN